MLFVLFFIAAFGGALVVSNMVALASDRWLNRFFARRLEVDRRARDRAYSRLLARGAK